MVVGTWTCRETVRCRWKRRQSWTRGGCFVVVFVESRRRRRRRRRWWLVRRRFVSGVITRARPRVISAPGKRPATRRRHSRARYESDTSQRPRQVRTPLLRSYLWRSHSFGVASLARPIMHQIFLFLIVVCTSVRIHASSSWPVLKRFLVRRPRSQRFRASHVFSRRTSKFFSAVICKNETYKLAYSSLGLILIFF